MNDQCSDTIDNVPTASGRLTCTLKTHTHPNHFYYGILGQARWVRYSDGRTFLHSFYFEGIDREPAE